MPRSAQDVRRQSRGSSWPEPGNTDGGMLRAARPERGGEDNHHRNPGRLAGTHFRRGLDSGTRLERECSRDARVARYLAAGDAAVGKTYRARDHRALRQLLSRAALVRRSARATRTDRESRLLGGKVIGRATSATGGGDGAGLQSEDFIFGRTDHGT